MAYVLATGSTMRQTRRKESDLPTVSDTTEELVASMFRLARREFVRVLGIILWRSCPKMYVGTGPRREKPYGLHSEVLQSRRTDPKNRVICLPPPNKGRDEKSWRHSSQAAAAELLIALNNGRDRIPSDTPDITNWVPLFKTNALNR